MLLLVNVCDTKWSQPLRWISPYHFWILSVLLLLLSLLPSPKPHRLQIKGGMGGHKEYVLINKN